MLNGNVRCAELISLPHSLRPWMLQTHTRTRITTYTHCVLHRLFWMSSGEGAALVKTCEAMCELMRELGIAIDGGKDSLSMAAKVKLNASRTEVVK